MMHAKLLLGVLLRKYIPIPKGQRLHDVVNGFKTKWGMIQFCDAIDGTHMPVTPPLLEHTNYFNRKGWYSIILQGVIDHNYLFEDMWDGLEVSIMPEY